MSHHDETKPEGLTKAPRADDDDVEGHSFTRAAAPEGLTKAPRADGDDDDVEGHYGQLKSPASRGE